MLLLDQTSYRLLWTLAGKKSLKALESEHSQILKESQNIEDGNFTGWVFHFYDFSPTVATNRFLAKTLHSLWPEEPRDRVWDNRNCYKVSEDSGKKKTREWAQCLSKYSAKIPCWILNLVWTIVLKKKWKKNPKPN